MEKFHGDGGNMFEDVSNPVCTFCLDGQHDNCPDLMYSPYYGMYACGCEDSVHYND